MSSKRTSTCQVLPYTFSVAYALFASPFAFPFPLPFTPCPFSGAPRQASWLTRSPSRSLAFWCAKGSSDGGRYEAALVEGKLEAGVHRGANGMCAS